MLSFYVVFMLTQQSDLDKALKEAEASKKTEPLASTQLGPAKLSLLDFSLDGLFAVGASNQKEEEVATLQSGGHDPRKRGFTVQNVELAATGAVDPYFQARANIVWFIDPGSGETGMELEEAFVLTTSLPSGLQVKAGQFFTEFGRMNAQHPHQWDFQDQPVVISRMFGEDGMRGAGLRVGWLMPLPFYSELIGGVQNANGETMTSFLSSDEVFDPLEGHPVGGRQFVDQTVRNLADMAYHLRWSASFDLSPEITAVGGLSGLFGPNATGPEGATRLFGVDLRVKWMPETNFRGWPFVIWQTEYIVRNYKTQAQDFDPDGVPASGDEFNVDGTLKDQGFYTFLLWGFAPEWVAGLRFESCSGSEDSVIYDAAGAATGLSDEDDPFHDTRTRLSLMLGWHPTHFSRLRLQYNFDRADHLDNLHDADAIDEGVGHTVWFGFEFMFGAHAAHTY